MPQITANQVTETLKQAQTFQAQGHLNDGVDLCNQILESGFERPDVRYFLGLLYLDLWRLEDAIQQFQRLLNDLDYALSCHYALGECYRLLCNPHIAAVHFGEAVNRVNLDALTEEESNQLVQLCQETAEIYHIIGDQAQARSIYDTLLRFLRSRGWTEQISKVEVLLQQPQDGVPGVKLSAFAPTKLALPAVTKNSTPSFREKVELMTQTPRPKDANEQSSPAASLSPVKLSQPSLNTSMTGASSTLTQLQHQILSLSAEEQKEITLRALRSLSRKEKDEIIHQAGIRPITQEATDFIWKVVVSGSVLVFVGSAFAIGVAVFMNVNVAPLITIFTAVIAFLGGLLAPSPLQSAVRSLSSGFRASSKESDEE